MKRRAVIKSLLCLIGMGLVSGFYSWQIEPFWIEFVQQKMPINNLPKHLVGKTLMQISDIHIGKRFNYKYIIKCFEKAKEYKPDFVAYTGDYISLHEGEVQYDLLQEVMQHAVIGKIGTVGILGNHDYGKKWKEQSVADNISSLISQRGITVLRNQQQNFNELNFIGFDDYWGLNFAPQQVMKDYDNLKANVVLCHNPDVCDINVWNNYKGWILSGHTHGGQVKPPFLDPPMLPVKNKRYSSSKIDLYDGRTLYINRATGHLWQVRFNVRPEITIFELIKA